MEKSAESIFPDAYEKAKRNSLESLLAGLSTEQVEGLKTIVKYAPAQKAVLGALLTSIAYKLFAPTQDIRFHKKDLPNGYSGRTFDTRYTTPFLQEKFSLFAMTESSWLTRSLEQPHPFTLDFPGKIRSQELKTAFLYLLDQLQTKNIAAKLLPALLALMIDASAEDENSFLPEERIEELTINRIVEAVDQHLYHRYSVSGAARLPVLVIYAVYQLLLQDVKRYEGKRLAPLGLHTTADLRSQALGDIEILHADNSGFEAIEIKHRKPITAAMIGLVYRKIKHAKLTRYYILTTNEPNVEDSSAVQDILLDLRKKHPCQIIVNGVLPTLKYYLRLLRRPEAFVAVYSKCLQDEFQRASGIKKEHLKIWSEIWALYG
ncbi:MAG: hypothetical protein HY231_10200 [Acidobacteria bacterium]|nr:hypothetical protein [Acidobacteriota bacterium]